MEKGGRCRGLETATANTKKGRKENGAVSFLPVENELFSLHLLSGSASTLFTHRAVCLKAEGNMVDLDFLDLQDNDNDYS